MAKQLTTWRKRVLIPLWVIRIALMLVTIAAYAIVLRAVHTEDDDFDFDDRRVNVTMGVLILFMLLTIAVLLMDVLAIILFWRDALKPGTFLILNCIQTGFWSGVLILDLVAIGRGASAVGIAFTIFIWLTFVALLIYAIIGYRRARQQAQRGHYSQAHNPTMAASSAHPPAYMNPAPHEQDTAYSSQTDALLEHHNSHNHGHGEAADYYSAQPIKPAHMV